MLIYAFNEACKNISVSYLKVGNKSMSEIRFRNTSKGDLPHLPYSLFNMEPIDTEFKTFAYYFTGVLLLIEIHMGNEGMNNIKHHLQIGAATSCTKIITKATKGLGQRDVKGTMEDYFISDSWFS